MNTPPYLPAAGLLCCSLLLSLQPAAAQVDLLWLGGEGDFTSAANWSPEGNPTAPDHLTISSGNAVNTGNLNRGGTTVLDGTGLLTVTNGRFLNASGSPAEFRIAGGSLAQTGQFFIAALNNPGKIAHSSGSVSAAVTEAFYLSDGGGSSGTYELTGGSLNVVLSGTSALDRQVHLGKQNNGDRMLIDGGTATFTAASANRRFYLSRNSQLQIDSGTLNADGFFYFVLGRELAANTNSTAVLNGGQLNILNTPASGAFIVGAVNDGLLRLQGGNLSSNSGAMWLGDGNGRTGTVIHTAGTLDLGGQTLTLARAGGGSGQYQMDGGTLTAGDIIPGTGANPRFILRSGSVVLPGDRQAIVNEPWFSAAGQVSAVFDATANTTTLTGTPVAGKESTWRYFRLTVNRLRDPFNAAVQLAEVEFLRNGVVLDRSSVVTENPNGINPGTEVSGNLVDGDAATKWLDTTNQPVIFDFGAPVTVDSYRLVTANDATGRDPLRWTLEGSADGAAWTAVDRKVTDYPTPSGRFIPTLEIPLPLTVPEAPPAPVSLTWTGAVNGEWNTSSLNWANDGPRTWNNTSVLEAVFATGGPKSVSVPGPVTAGSVAFGAAGYTVTGAGPLTLGEPATVILSEPAALNVPVTGTSGWRKLGSGTLTLGGSLTNPGRTLLDGGQVVFNGTASAPGNGNLVLANGEDFRASLHLDSSGTFDFSGSVRVAPGDRSAAAVHQSAGTVTVGGPNIVEYLEIGGGIATATGSYGAWHLTGGTLNTAGGANPSGIRVGNEGLGVLLQTGGVLNSARWVAIGGGDGANGEGAASFLGGEATVAPGYRFLIGDRANAVGTLNLGSLAGGTATVTTLNSTGLSVAATGSSSRAFLNLNRGTLVLGGPIYREAGAADTRVNFNGATLKAGAPDISLLAAGIGHGTLYNGGLTVDTAGLNARIEGSVFAASGSGLYPAGGGFALTSGGSGYLGSPLVSVVGNGFGFGATAIAEVANGSIARVLITCPGQGYEAGETVSFVFSGGGAEEPVAFFDHVLTEADLAPHGAGGLVKTGDGKLTVSGNLSFAGDTLVQQGTLEINGTTDGTRITVPSGATLAGTLNTSGPVVVDGTLAPGSGVGSALGTSSLTLAAGSTLAVDLVDWNGDAGLGYDSVSFDSLTVSSTAAAKLTIAIDSTALENFTESARTFTLVAANGDVSGLTAGNWQVEAPGFPGAGTWQLAASGSSLLLQYVPGGSGTGFSAWLAGFPGLTDVSPGGDPDGDGVPNLLEYVLDGNPSTAFTAILPAAQVTDAGLVFTFVRRSESRQDTRQIFQYGSGLGAWTDLAIPSVSGGNVEITVNTPSTGRETVRITVPASAATGGRLFGRLAAERN